MASNTVNLGIGYSGMMYMADAGTSIPTDPAATLGASWVEVGAIDNDGIKLTIGNVRHGANANATAKLRAVASCGDEHVALFLHPFAFNLHLNALISKQTLDKR